MVTPRRMRVLHIVDVLHFDGRTSVLLELIRRSGDSCDHVILTLNGLGPKAEPFRQMGIPVYSLRRGPRAGRLKRSIIAAFRALRPLPDVVVTWSMGACFWSLALRVAFRPVVWTVHNSVEKWSRRRERLGVRILSVLSFVVPSRVVCCSPQVRSVYERSHGFRAGKLVAIENGVDFDEFRPDEDRRRRIRETLGVSADGLLVASAARFAVGKSNADVKNTFGLIDAVSMAHKRHPEIHLVLFGTNADGSNAELRERLSSAGLTANAHLLGQRRDIAEILCGCDAYAMTSPSEGLPVALIEAIASGLVPICMDAGGIRDAIGSVGYLIAQGDLAAFSSAIDKVAGMSTEARRQFGHVLREEARTRFDIGVAVEAYLSVVRNAAGPAA